MSSAPPALPVLYRGVTEAIVCIAGFGVILLGLSFVGAIQVPLLHRHGRLPERSSGVTLIAVGVLDVTGKWAPLLRLMQS